MESQKILNSLNLTRHSRFCDKTRTNHLTIYHLRSEPRICLRENQNKGKEPFFKIASSGTFSCSASW